MHPSDGRGNSSSTLCASSNPTMVSSPCCYAADATGLRRALEGVIERGRKEGAA
jgi:hypothetical protein